VKLPKSDWVITPGAFQPIVDIEMFDKAQMLLMEGTIHLTDEEILARLRELLTAKRKLTPHIIQDWPSTPSASTYRRRFGSLRRAYELAGYANPDQFKHMSLRRRARALRDELFSRIVSAFRGEAAIVKKNERWRSRLRLSNGMIVSVLIACSLKTAHGAVRWQVHPNANERNSATLLARLTEDNSAILDLHVFPRIERNGRFRISLADGWLKLGLRLRSVERLRQTLEKLRCVDHPLK